MVGNPKLTMKKEHNKVYVREYEATGLANIRVIFSLQFNTIQAYGWRPHSLLLACPSTHIHMLAMYLQVNFLLLFYIEMQMRPGL